MNTHYKISGKALTLANAFGFLFPAEVFLLQSLAQALPENAVMVCIGAGAGTGSLALAEIHPQAILYTIDISEGGPNGGFENEKNAFRAAEIEKLLPFQVLGDSGKIHKDWKKISKNKKIDLLFIDGDHAASALQADIDGWCKYVCPGGYVLFHDYNSVSWSDVTRVVDKNMLPNPENHWRYVHAVDTLIAFQRVT